MTAFFCQKHPIKVFIQTSLVEAMPHQSVIQPSMSLCASPVVLVPQKDDFYVDYLKLNSVTKKCVHPFSRIDDILGAHGSMNYFSLGKWYLIQTVG